MDQTKRSSTQSRQINLHTFYTRFCRIQHHTQPNHKQHFDSNHSKFKNTWTYTRHKKNFKEHTKLTKAKADKSINILKTLTTTKWGKQKETILAAYKALTRPIIEYASTIWSPIVKSTNIAKLQTTQNTALRIATGRTADTNTNHIHQETKILPLPQHLKLHASLLRQKAKQNYHHTL